MFTFIAQKLEQKIKPMIQTEQKLIKVDPTKINPKKVTSTEAFEMTLASSKIKRKLDIKVPKSEPKVNAPNEKEPKVKTKVKSEPKIVQNSKKRKEVTNVKI
jgi:hypothetical protein